MASSLRPATPLDGSTVLTDDQIAQYVKPDSNADAALITMLRDTAIEWVERYTTIGLTSRIWRASFDVVTPVLSLGRSPVTSITSVAYNLLSGIPATITSFDLDNFGLRTYGWLAPAWNSPVVVTFVAGFENAKDIPPQLPVAALMMLRHLYDGESSDNPPTTVMMLCDQFRTPVIG